MLGTCLDIIKLTGHWDWIPLLSSITYKTKTRILRTLITNQIKGLESYFNLFPGVLNFMTLLPSRRFYDK